MNVLDFKKRKLINSKISMITAYDYATARIVNSSDIDVVLVGDSVSMICHGYDSTIHATVEMIEMHIKAVHRGAPDKFIIGDMPFLSTRKGLGYAMESVEKLLRAGAIAVKIEGVDGHENIIKHIVDSGIPVMGHLGLTPQSVNAFGGHKLQGKKKDDAKKIIIAAKKLEKLGCFGIVLECIPTGLARHITENINIPTIGIGAGPFCDGQVMVINDLLGMSEARCPRFVRKYQEFAIDIKKSINQFHQDVITSDYPNVSESYLYSEEKDEDFQLYQ